MKKVSKTQSLNRRITSMLLSLMLAVAVVLGAVSYTAIRRTYLRFYNEKAQQLVHTLASRTDWEELEHYAKTGEIDEYAAELISFYDSVKENFAPNGYLYIFVPGEDSFTYLYDAQVPGDDPAEINHWGEKFEYTEFEYRYLVPDVQAGRGHEEILYTGENGYGGCLETWAPIFDEAGALQAMVELDIFMPSFRHDLNSFMILFIGAFILVVATLALGVMLWYLKRNVTEPLDQLTDIVDAYEHGEIEEAHFRHNDEIQSLANSFGEMTRRVALYTDEVARVTAEKERIGAELGIATQIQADMLPRIFPAFPDRTEFDLYASMTPAKEVGGDFYDFFVVDDDHICLVMADVSGKGVPAALFMVIAKTLIKNRTMAGGTPAEILSSVNEQLCEGNEAELFVTVWMAIIELSTGKGIAANAGHEHPVIRRKDGKYELSVYRHSMAVAVMEGARFREHEFELHPGDSLFVYTDGVAEAMNVKNELFGTERMLAALNSDTEASPEQLLQNVRSAIDEFVGDAPQFDDITMLSFRYDGAEGAK